ncbi:MAG: hypothetical protein M3Q23_13710 [Actinomycetota bacterium]|nr:hypothetical protein [Actinomycetota bacterium]
MSEDDNLPAWNGKAGRYEVWFLTASDGQIGYWIRYTLLAPTGAAPEARLWFARFDRDRPEDILALNRGLPIEDYATGGSDSFEVRMGDAFLRSGRAEGAISGGGHEVSWALSFDVGEPTYRLLPDALYRGGLAPTKPFSPNPRTRFTGTVTVAGREHVVEEMPGQQGHLYGPRHAERWVWAACSAFEEDGDVAIQALTAQGKRGPFVTPFTTFVGLRWRGQWLRFSKLSRRRDSALGAWRIDVANRRFRLTGRVAGDPAYLVQARYIDPDGSERYCHNTEVGSSRFVLFERRGAGFEEVAVLISVGTTHAEWAGRTPAPGEFTPHRPVG